MDDQDNPLHDLTGEQLLERARDLQLEATYWQQELGDIGKISDELDRVTHALLSSTVATGILATHADPIVGSMSAQVLEANATAMPVIRRCMHLLLGLIELANGRSIAVDRTIKAISEASGVPLDDDDDEAES